MNYRRIARNKLVRQALRAYHKSKELAETSGIRWNTILGNTLKAKGWEVFHRGSDKWVALRGIVAVKWIGYSYYSRSPILDEIVLYNRLINLNLRHHTPEVYARKNNEIIIEQRIDTRPDEEEVYFFKNFLRNDMNIDIQDCRQANTAVLNGVIKVIDGRLGSRHRDG